MKATCMSYMGPKYHRHMRSTMRMVSRNQHGRAVTTPMVQVDRATIGHLVVATIVIYITWVILQVFQRSMDRYLE